MSENSNENTLLTRLKIDIGIINDTTFDNRLTSLIQTAESEVSKFVGESVDTSDIRDAELVIDYARWQWLSRREPAAMPVSLKYRLNCRAFERNISDGSDES
jgi:hypothetical protein